MANCCDFLIKAKGFKNEEDKQAFKDVFLNNYENPDFFNEESGDELATEYNSVDNRLPYMAINSCIVNDENGVVSIDGYCKWSLKYSMMRSSEDRKGSKMTNLEELSKKYGVVIEGYSKETGMCFQEHVLVRNGVVEINKEVPYEENCLDDEEWEELKRDYENGDGAKHGPIEKVRYAIENDTYSLPEGGFEKWDFKAIEEA